MRNEINIIYYGTKNSFRQESVYGLDTKIEQAGIAIFVYGNKIDSANNIVLSEGMKEEFELCKDAGVLPIPVGATGYMAEKLWNEGWEDFDTCYPDASPSFKGNFEKLGDKSLATSYLISIILDLIQDIQRGY